MKSKEKSIEEEFYEYFRNDVRPADVYALMQVYRKTYKTCEPLINLIIRKEK